MFFNNKFNTFFGLNLTLVYTFPMCMTWRFHFPLRNYDFKAKLKTCKTMITCLTHTSTLSSSDFPGPPSSTYNCYHWHQQRGTLSSLFMYLVPYWAMQIVKYNSQKEEVGPTHRKLTYTTCSRLNACNKQPFACRQT